MSNNKMNNNQSAVEWLIKELKDFGTPIPSELEYKAKQIETDLQEEQYKRGYGDGYDEGYNDYAEELDS